MANNGYLERDRLAHVIAAIQIMAVAEAPSDSLGRWIGELDAGEAAPDGQRDRQAIHYADRKKWTSVFEEHPEFFKSFTVKGEPHVALRMRLALSKSNGAEADSGKRGDPELEAGGENVDNAPAAEPSKRAKTAVPPLTPDQIDVLINTAIKLHTVIAGDARTPEEKGGGRWLFSAAGAVVGSIVAGTVMAFMAWSPAAFQIFD
jgi:hypothetical protein